MHKTTADKEVNKMKKAYFEEAVMERILFGSDVITDSSMSNIEEGPDGFGTNDITESGWNSPVNM